MTNQNGSRTAVSRRGFIELAFTAGVGLVALNSSPNIAWAAGEGLSKAGVKARFVIGSDVHIQNGYLGDDQADEIGNEPTDSDKKLTFIFEVGRQLGGVDSYAFIGDVTDAGYISQYHRLISVLKEANTDNTRVIVCQGNHETGAFNWGATIFDMQNARKRFEDQLKDFQGGQKANDVVEVNGVKVIKMGPMGYGGNGDYRGNASWFTGTALPQTTDGEPFLVLCHHQIPGTTYTSIEWSGTYSDDMIDAMKQHPNLIHISGHSHATVEDERSIGQDFGFTAIQDGTAGAYYENETGKVDPETGTTADSKGLRTSCPPQYSDTYTKDKEITDGSDCLIVDVNNDRTVKVYRVSLVRTKAGDEKGGIVYLYDPWTIDVPKIIAANGDTTNTEAFPYTNARQSTAAPYFDEGATVEVEPLNSSATVRFPAAIPGSEKNADMIHEYKLTATPVNGGDAVTKRIFSDYYRPAAYVKKQWEVAFKGLQENTEYTVSVEAQTSWNKEPGSEGAGSWEGSTTAPNSTSEALVSAAFTTGQLNRPDYALNIDFRTGSADDAKGHTLTERGGSLVDDDTVVAGKTVKVFEADGEGGFAYQLKDTDYDYFSDGHMTTEVYYKLPAGQDISAGGDHCLFSNQEGNGSGFEISSDQLQFWYHSNGSYKTPSVAAETGVWVHAMAVADGKNVTLYVNGKQVAQQDAGALDVPGPKTYYVGCDTDGGGNPQGAGYKGTRIALARVYCKALTADEVKAAYAAVGGEVKPVELAALLNVDFRRRSAKDWAAGHTLDRSHYSGGTRMDKKLRQPVAMMDGKGGLRYELADGDYTKMAADGFTTELLFRLPKIDEDEHALFSSQEMSGSGFEVTGDQLQFWYNPANGDRVVPSTTVEAGTWYHAVAVSDGSNVTLYVNGEQKAVANAGSVKPGPKYYYVGCDTDADGNPQFVSLRNTAIAFARVHTGAASAEQVAELYKKSGLAGK